MNEIFFFNEGNQIHNVISSSGTGTVINYSSGSGTVINYGSGSDFLTSYGSDSGSGSTGQKLRFLRFRFRFHNADGNYQYLNSNPWNYFLLYHKLVPLCFSGHLR